MLRLLFSVIFKARPPEDTFFTVPVGFMGGIRHKNPHIFHNYIHSKYLYIDVRTCTLH